MCNKQELGQSTALGLAKQAFPRYTNQQEWLRILHCSHLPQPSPKIVTQRKASPCTLCFRQVSEAITSGETAKPSWILMWKEKSESYPGLLNAEENQSCRTSHKWEKVSYPRKVKLLLLVSAPVVPLERKWLHSNCGFSEYFILIGEEEVLL